jgi:hypothetical protein
MLVSEWEGHIEDILSPYGNDVLVRLEGPFSLPMSKGDKIRISVEKIMNDYPGQAYFHAHNANIKATEDRWEAKQL